MKEITAYLNFDGNCREAMTFYQQCLGGELFVMTFGEGASQGAFEAPPEARDRVLHARLANGATVVMASDTMPGMPFREGNNVWLSLNCDSVDEVRKVFDALGAGGREVMAPHDSFWGARFAMLTDRFGMDWMLSHELPKQS